MKNEPFAAGEVVLSRAGRDRGRAFVIVQVLDADYVLLADGRLRTLDRPKKKKCRHLQRTSIEARLELTPHLLDADVRKFLVTQGYENDRKE